jgi:hypothetical protein
MKPTIGRIVHYTLSGMDVAKITQARTKDLDTEGNAVREGDVFPMLITRVWGSTPESAVQGQVFLDGNDTLWVTAVVVGEGPRTYAWPTITKEN